MNDPIETVAQLDIDRLVQEAVDDGRKLVTVRKIDAIDDIPGADLIKVATIEGWKVVVRVGEFKPGDLCVFFEVDSFIQLTDPRFAFLEKNKITWNGIEGARLKTIRLKKQLSQGLALPLDLFPEILEVIHDYYCPLTDDTIEDIRQLNFTGLLRVMKYEKVMSSQLAGQAKGNFPSWLRKSDQERCQNFGAEIFGTNTWEHNGLLLSRDPIPIDVPLDAVQDALAAGRMEQVNDLIYLVKGQAKGPAQYEVTLKLDGSSMTVYSTAKHYDEEPTFGVCSRNLELKLEGNEENAFVQAAKPILELLKELPSTANIALQGELMGPGIQGNREKLTKLRFFVYNIFDIVKSEFLTPPERKEWIKNANSVMNVLEHVPVLYESTTLEELGITNMDELLRFADGPSLSNSVREGLVFKAHDNRHQFKVISNGCLEAEK